MENKLMTFIESCAERHDFGSKTKTKNMRQKYASLFSLIYSKIASTGDLTRTVEIPISEFVKVLKTASSDYYKHLLNLMYDDGLIYFSMGEAGNIKNGNKMMAKTRKSVGHFCGKYKLEKALADGIMNFNFSEVKPRPEAESIAALRESSYHKDLKKVDRLLEHLDYVNKNLNMSYVDFPLPLERALVETWKQPEYESKLHVTLHHVSESLDDDDAQVDGKKIFTDNQTYMTLYWWHDGIWRPLLKELPHYGRCKDGRIYSIFHSMPREERKNVRIEICKPIAELVDIPHAFPLLLAYILKDDKQIDRDEWERYVNEVKNLDRTDDVYCHILRNAGIDPSGEVKKNEGGKIITTTHRDEVKQYVQIWIYTKPTDKVKKPKAGQIDYFGAVDKFYSEQYQTIARRVKLWQTITTQTFDKNKLCYVKKTVKTINGCFQRLEKRVMDHICSLISCPYVTLHDCVYVADENIPKYADVDFNDEILKFLDSI